LPYLNIPPSPCSRRRGCWSIETVLSRHARPDRGGQLAARLTGMRAERFAGLLGLWRRALPG